MTGRSWQFNVVPIILFGLIAVGLLLVALLLVAPGLLRGQDMPAPGGSVRALTPEFSSRAARAAPDGIPSRFGAARYPVARPPEISGSGAWVQMVRAAGIIFSGRVTAVGRAGTGVSPRLAGTAVTFHVENAIRGSTAGKELTIHEWGVLGGQRFRVGERVMLFLYAPSRLGFTSPVAGAMGRFAVDFRGGIVLSSQHIEAMAEDPVLGGKTVASYLELAEAVMRASRRE